MVAVPRFCGRCGSPLAPGAPFCGRCGAPQQVVAAVAAPAPYVYRAAPPGAFPGTRSPRLSQIMVAASLLVILSVATVAISAFAVSRVIGGTRASCTAKCNPKIVTPLPASSTYKSSAFKYEVDYNDQWTVRSSDANGISLGTKIGTLDVTGTKASTDLPGLIQGSVTALPSATWQNVTRYADLKGAHIGEQDGLGAVTQPTWSGRMRQRPR